MIPRTIEIDGRPYLWRDLLELRRLRLEQRQRAVQPTLFPVQHDVRPAIDRRGDDRYREPRLFDWLSMRG